MDTAALISALINAGGLGLLSAALFYLHTSSLKAFREELSQEREQCREDHGKIMEAVSSNHELLTAILHRATPRA